MNLCVEDWANKHYKYAIGKEIGLGKKGTTAPAVWPPFLDIHPAINSYRNLKVIGTGSEEETGWYKILVEKYAGRGRGLSLGTGAGRNERWLYEMGFVDNWDTIDLVECKGIALSRKMVGESQIGDLNFICLPEKKYSVVLSIGVLHHIVNLEHILFEINKTLTEEGILVVHEYCGENKWQWSDKKIGLINKELKKRLGKKYPKFRLTRRSLEEMSGRPLESIRSEDIYPLINKVFGNHTELEVHYNRALYPVLNDMWRVYEKEWLIKNEEILKNLLKLLIELNEEIDSNKNDLMPTELIGIYRKNRCLEVIQAFKWSENKIRYELGCQATFHRRVRSYLREFNSMRRLYSFIRNKSGRGRSH